MIFRWKTEGYKEGGIKSMAHARSYASAVLNEDGNLWILGGTAEDQASDTTEVYEYAPRGEGIWRKGPQLPPDYRDTGIESHCTVRYLIRLVLFIKNMQMLKCFFKRFSYLCMIKNFSG